MLTRDEIAAWQKKLGLTYHIDYALNGAQMVGFRGKRVLEIGGSLPEAFVREVLGVRNWIGIEELEYWSEIATSGGVQGTPPGSVVRKAADADQDDLDRPYGVLAGRIEDLPAELHGHFDAVFSIAAFEHIHKLAPTLDACHAALKPGGKLFTIFGPLWSSFQGHHLPMVRDKKGQTFEFGQSPIPPWGHLLMRPPEMYQHLLAHTDPATAAEMVYFIYHSAHINRLFTEDYIAYCQASPLTIEHCEAMFPVKMPENAQAELESRHPGRKHFSNISLRVVLRKD